MSDLNHHHISDIRLSTKGEQRIAWSAKFMPVLNQIAKRFAKYKPLKGHRIGACLHVTAETGNLAIALAAGGADVALCASNPLSTQDDVAAALVKFHGIHVFAVRGENKDTYYDHIHKVIDENPTVTLDDGADLINTLHTSRTKEMKHILGSMEETTTGVIRLRAMAKDGALKIPVFAVNNAHTKYLFDNRYGTGQSTIDGIIRATNLLLAGKNFVVAGYGWCGRGVAMRARGLGANVIVTEIDEIRALEAVMDGYKVMRMEDAVKVGDIFCTLTGNRDVLRGEHFEMMKDGAVICNSGHFNVEIDIPALERLSRKVKKAIRNGIDEYIMKDGRSIFLLAEGRLVNLACAEGHPPDVMDMSFATQALMVEYVIKHHGKFLPVVNNVPEEIEKQVASLKLKAMGIRIDKMNQAQKKYVESWKEGT